MSNRYEDKQAARRERFEDLADKNAQRSTDYLAGQRQRWGRALTASGGCAPLGVHFSRG